MLEIADALRGLNAKARRRFYDRLSEIESGQLARDWGMHGRATQRPPEGDWRVWLMMAGRGFGKTRAGAEWVRDLAERDGSLRIALVGATMAEARAVMVEGESGLLGIAPPAFRPDWEPSLRRLRWPNGAMASLYSAAEPDSLRGPQHHHAWADEIAKWPLAIETWDNLMLGLRIGERPRVLATTTPRPVALLRRLLAEDGVVVSRGRTEDNAAHLSGAFLTAVRAAYGSTRLGRQELDGELIEELEGALWSRETIERCRARSLPAMRRILVGVDPPAGSGIKSDACGIVVVGLGSDGLGYVIEDASVQGRSPEGWSRAVARAADKAEMIESFSGSGNAGRPMLLEGGLKWQAMSLTPADMDFVGLKAAAAREIAMAFGVPPMLLGLPGDTAYANYAEANRALWRLTIVPLAGRLLHGIEEALRAWWPALRLALDLDGLPALASDREALWGQLKDAAFLSDDEKREMLGFGPRDAAKEQAR